jgi:hypothetical protein
VTTANPFLEPAVLADIASLSGLPRILKSNKPEVFHLFQSSVTLQNLWALLEMARFAAHQRLKTGGDSNPQNLI